jgi:cytochrome c553
MTRIVLRQRAPFARAATILTLALACSAHAADAPQRLGLCASCHGRQGMATMSAVPNLAGQNLEYLRSAAQQYVSGARDVAAMRAAVGMLSARDLDAVLAWYAAQRTPGDAAP